MAGASGRTGRTGRTGRKRVLVLLASAALLAGCHVRPDLVTGPPRLPFPTGLVPADLDGLTVKPEPSAVAAFAAVGPQPAVARGQVWTLRNKALVVGDIQISQLKGGLSTASERVRQGIRAAVNNGSYRWFKVLDRQWVGVQTQPQLVIYLWLPPRTDIYELAQVRDSYPLSQQLVTDLIAYQEGSG